MTCVLQAFDGNQKNAWPKVYFCGVPCMWSDTAFLIPSTSHARSWTDVTHTYLHTHACTSLRALGSGGATVYVGYDDDDRILASPEARAALAELHPHLAFRWTAFSPDKGNVVRIWNALAEQALQDGKAYLMVAGDDIVYPQEESTTWLQTLRGSLRAQHHVGWASGFSGNDRIATQFLVHKTHVQLLGWVFPPAMRNWYCDDFLNEVYPSTYRAWHKDVQIPNAGGTERYTPNVEHRALCDQLVAQHRAPLARAIEARVAAEAQEREHLILHHHVHVQREMTKLRSPVWDQFVDKLRMKAFCAARGVRTPLTKQIFQSPYDDIDLLALQQPFILKSNKGCGRNLIVRDGIMLSSGWAHHHKRLADHLADVPGLLRSWSLPYCNKEHEPQYEYTTPQVYEEEFMDPIPDDMEVWVHQGTARFVWVATDRFGQNTRTVCDAHFRPMPFQMHGRKPTACFTPPPVHLRDAIIRTAEIVAADVPMDFLRIDLYVKDDVVHCGEITLSSQGGTGRCTRV